MPKIASAEASPTKSFFVRMITKDISLTDCILDLIDNSIDEAWSKEGSRPTGLDQMVDLSAYEINITANEEGFTIWDNCGGMTLHTAMHNAFTFGRKQDLEKYSIGVYGIGMKRAVFKMGDRIEVRSTYVSNGELDSFRIPINIPAWLSPNADDDWDFPIYDSKHLSAPGVKVNVTNLNKDTKAAFSSDLFQANLRKTISRDYTIHLRYGLNIILNGIHIRGWQIELRRGGSFKPLRKSYVDHIDDAGSVNVEILAGMAAPPPDGDDADGQEDGDERYGWYVVCNGRVVLAADKSSTSGWGTDGWNQWHGQYNGFIGLVVFSSEKASLLPLTTTKRSVDTSSAVFRRAQPTMRHASKAWTDYTNSRKGDLDGAKRAEAATRAVPIYALDHVQSVELPRLTSKPREKNANINYSVKLSRFRKLADALGNINMQYRELGIKTFDIVYDDNVDEQE